MALKSNISPKQQLISKELEMEKSARLALEKKLQEKENEIIKLKHRLQEKELNHSTLGCIQFLNAIIDHLPIGIVIENEIGLVININKSFCELLKINTPIDELVGIDINNSLHFIQEEFLDTLSFFQRTNEILNDRTLVKYDIIELKNGNKLERDFIPLFEGSEYKGHIWLYHNTSIRNKLEKQLDKQKAIYEKVISHLPIDIAVLKSDYAELFLNPIAIKDIELRQWTIEWLIKQKNNQLNQNSHDVNDITSYKKLFNYVTTTKLSGFVEEAKRKEDGELQYLLRGLNPILDDTGNIEMLIGYNTDITDRVRAENELKNAIEITEKLSEAKDLFLATVSHEIRTPMSGILGVVDLLVKTKLNQKQYKMASMIKDASSNLLAIVNDILHLEKINSGKLVLESIPFSVVEKIGLIIDSFKLRVKEKKLYLNFENKLIDNPIIVGDPYRLSQILNNFLSNAIKFTDQGGITIALSAITETENEIWLKIEIQDTGIGIVPEKIEQLFEPYIQADSSTTRKYGGTGLGLSICKTLTKMLGGRIAVDSKPGIGSTFSCLIPFKKELNLNHKNIVEDDYENLRGCKILLAEDVEMNQFIARSILENKQMQISIAKNGKEVIEKVQQTVYDIILMDISMPYIDGMQATSIIRSMKNPLKNSIPIIAVTANALNGDEKKYKDAGMNGYISKPFQEDQLLSVIAKTLATKDFILSPDQIEPIGYPQNKLYNENLIMGWGKNKTAFVEKMIGLFLKTMPTDMEQLSLSASKQDWKMVEKTAHRMKSAIRGLGIKIATKPIKRIEEIAQTMPSDPQLLVEIKSVTQLLNHVIEQINSDYPHLKIHK
ncbi:ATP-binding protein [Sediminibacterium sp.]|uniref:ATP-binding protein n=1 Tax=Sediminibacterium sp. TaxID=1917865 RepID=UPI003F72ECB9